MGNPTSCIGPDKQVPPKERAEGHARRARRIEMDNQTLFSGPDKQVPPRVRGLA
jgi:hypothetical protein